MEDRLRKGIVLHPPGRGPRTLEGLQHRKPPMAAQPPPSDGGKPRPDPERPTPAFTETGPQGGSRKPADAAPERGDTQPSAPSPSPPESDVDPETPASIHSP